MADLEVREVRSNVSALSAERLHRALVAMVENAVQGGTDAMRGLVPHRSGLMAEHVDRTRVEDIASLIRAKIGITAVHEADDRASAGRYRRSQYPLFVLGGTHTPIFPAKASAMWNPKEGIFGRKQVRGQTRQDFLGATVAYAHAVMRTDQEIAKALDEMRAQAVAMAAAMRI